MSIHKCIKPSCPNSYEDDDIDAYYCPDCIVSNRNIAETIDAKLKSRSSNNSVSLLREYNSLPKGKLGFPVFRG